MKSGETKNLGYLLVKAKGKEGIEDGNMISLLILNVPTLGLTNEIIQKAKSGFRQF